MKNYIPSPMHWKEMFNKYDFYECEDKVLIEKIKVDRTLFDFDNPVDKSQVFYMLVNFDREAWLPITVNKEYFLLDGQHRLEVARQLGLKYIDIAMQDDSKMF